MASFYSLLGCLAVGSFAESEPGSFDLLSRLPVEMALTILRMLPAQDLLRAVQVSRTWLRLCRSDPVLRQRARRCLRQRRRALLAAMMGRRQGHEGQVRDLAVRVVTNTQRPGSSSRRESDIQFGAFNQQRLSYHRDLFVKPKKPRNLETIDRPVKKLRL